MPQIFFCGFFFMNILKPTDKNLFFSKNDPDDIRLGELVNTKNKASSYFHILGYPDDEGIHNNGGRVGASKGPDSIRKLLYKMTPQQQSLEITDHGNLNTNDFALAERHNKLINYLEENKIHKWIGLGGGHDYGYVDGFHFLQMKHNNKPLIINIDAHLDVRSDYNSINSGTPFFRLKREFKDSFDMIQVGIQPQCNSQTHIKWCKEHNISVLTTTALRDSQLSLTEYFMKYFGSHVISCRPCFLSIDIDGFSSNIAPGCSQSWPSGLEYNEVVEFTHMLYKRLNVLGLGVYEVSPPLDVNDLTSRLAALLVYNYITHN